MWIIVIDPISGRRKGAIFGRRAMNLFDSRAIQYRMISGASSEQTSHNLTNFLPKRRNARALWQWVVIDRFISSFTTWQAIRFL
jgi:hypothetical protein